MPSLFDPLKLGAIRLPNRILMAPLTRSRATPDGRVPTPLQRDYYAQRAGAGLIPASHVRRLSRERATTASARALTRGMSTVTAPPTTTPYSAARRAT